MLCESGPNFPDTIQQHEEMLVKNKDGEEEAAKTIWRTGEEVMLNRLKTSRSFLCGVNFNGMARR